MEDALGFLTLGIGAAIVVAMVLMAWKGHFSRLNYIGFAVGFGVPGVLFLSSTYTIRNTTQLVLGAVGFLMTAVAFGSIVAQFFYRTPKNSR